MTDTTSGKPYALRGVSGVEIPAGTNLLVTAPEPTGSEFLLELLEDGRREGDDLLVLTTDSPAGRITDRLEAGVGEATADGTGGVTVIDSQTEPIDAADDAEVVQNVNTPRNLTDIGIGFKEAFDEFEAAGIDRVRFGLLSLSITLSYVDQETAYRFCRTLTRGISQEGAVGFFLLNRDAHDTETVSTLRRAFDGVLEVEATEDGRRVRLSGLDGISEEWRPVDG
jgi:KaiC/GvpD/RAD55 family RecA-like ATPase